MLSRFSRVRLFTIPWTVQSHGLYKPMRLLCPWDSPGKNTGVGCHFLLQGDLPDPEIKPTSLRSPALVGWFFTTSTTWEAFWGYSGPNLVGQDGASPSGEGGTSNSHRHPSEAGLRWALDPQGESQWGGEVARRQCSGSVTEEPYGLRKR